MSRQPTVNKKIISWHFAGKFFLSLFTLYVGVAIGFASLSPYDYTRVNQNFLLSGVTVLIQPTMEVFANGKVTHFYDYKSLPLNEIPTITAADIISSKPQFRDFGENAGSNLTNILASLGAVSEAAIIEPVNYTGNWSLGFCQIILNQAKPVCQISKIKYSGQVKILVDGTSYIWGQTENGDWIELKVVNYINRWERRHILFV